MYIYVLQITDIDNRLMHNKDRQMAVSDVLNDKVREEMDVVHTPASPPPPCLSPPAPPLLLLSSLQASQLAAAAAPGSMSIIGSVT